MENYKDLLIKATIWPEMTNEHREIVNKVMDDLTNVCAFTQDWWVVKNKYCLRVETQVEQLFGAKKAFFMPNCTSAMYCAFATVGLGRGDEIIAPSITISCDTGHVYQFGATVRFAEVDDNLCIDASSCERLINERTRAIVVVHQYGFPANMDALCQVAKKHNIPLIEDVSHAQGGLYKGKKLGSIGDLAVFSMGSGKPLNTVVYGGGALLINDLEKYNDLATRACVPGMCATPETNMHGFDFSEIPMDDPDYGRRWRAACFGTLYFGHNFMPNFLNLGLASVSLEQYIPRMMEIQKALNLFWDLLEDVPGVRPHRTTEEGSTMGGWFHPVGRFVAEELNCSVSIYCQEVRKRGVHCKMFLGSCLPYIENPFLHCQELYTTVDLYHDGKPTRIANSTKDIREGPDDLPKTKSLITKFFTVPYFKRCDEECIKQTAQIYKDVAEAHKII